jgi:hypothetical protein
MAVSAQRGDALTDGVEVAAASAPAAPARAGCPGGENQDEIGGAAFRRRKRMTADEFRCLALSFPEASEGAHMSHPDFRVRGKIFATLGPDEDWGMVKLTADQQAYYVRAEPDVFRPASGAWGRRGCTIVRLRDAQELTVRQALSAAWRNTAPKRLARQYDEE